MSDRNPRKSDKKQPVKRIIGDYHDFQYFVLEESGDFSPNDELVDL